jgi:tRNA threonylcarbamoyladenosine biosynthesis protein TsaB
VPVLGIDTATWRASVGLANGTTIVLERWQQTTGNHAVSLLPLIDEVLRGAGLTLHDLDAIAVSAGPGSFTGLRVGLSVAKGLARAAAIPLVTVPTLEALALSVADRSGVICPLLDARKGELYAAAFEAAPGVWRRLMDDALLRPEVLIETLPTPCTILGDAVTRYASLFRERLGNRVTLLPSESYGPHGAVVAVLGRQRLEDFGVADLTAAEPLYIRPSEAETKFI